MTKGYSDIQSAKSQYINSDGRNPRSAHFDDSAKHDSSGVYHSNEVRDKFGDMFFIGSIKEYMKYTSKYTIKHVYISTP